jgi:hypothetical protein
MLGDITKDDIHLIPRHTHRYFYLFGSTYIISHRKFILCVCVCVCVCWWIFLCFFSHLNCDMKRKKIEQEDKNNHVDINLEMEIALLCDVFSVICYIYTNNTFFLLDCLLSTVILFYYLIYLFLANYHVNFIFRVQNMLLYFIWYSSYQPLLKITDSKMNFEK